ncbi:DUF3616 domain-containing protein [Ruegeria arenilitoris]|uniref:DUF3616 domain-containing protein n=1 Tax=Ruegeria arenilitoris TaxID=1173585 RepID=UPI00147AD9BF|nr:DUF3616 domain-containing protein [Ruegeria arenilitoris]
MRWLMSTVILAALPAFAESPKSLNVTGTFEEYEEHGDEIERGASVNVSGVACMADGLCFAAADEGRFVQTFKLEKDALFVGQRVYMAETKDKKKSELKDFDLEGVTVAGDNLIVVGSHSRGRKSCKSPTRNTRIFWGEVTPQHIGTRVPLSQQEVSLEPLFGKFDQLSAAFNVPLQQNGLNIEAVGAVGDRLFIGFRAPYPEVEPTRVLIAETTLDALENEDFSGAKLHEVQLNAEPGRGIRGMEAQGDDLLLLVGDAGVAAGEGDEEGCDQNSPHRFDTFSLHRWTPGPDAAERVMDIVPPEADWKAEGLLPLDENRVVVFFDGPENGSPQI